VFYRGVRIVVEKKKKNGKLNDAEEDTRLLFGESAECSQNLDR
jgi:hypothetical protein